MGSGGCGSHGSAGAGEAWAGAGAGADRTVRLGRMRLSRFGWGGCGSHGSAGAGEAWAGAGAGAGAALTVRLGLVRPGRVPWRQLELGELPKGRRTGAQRRLAPRRTAVRPPDHRVEQIPQVPQWRAGRVGALPVRVRRRICRIFPVCTAAQILVLAPQLVAGPLRNAPAHHGLPFCSRTPDASSASRKRPDAARPEPGPRSAAFGRLEVTVGTATRTVGWVSKAGHKPARRF
jgi:hypothetical protein